MNFDRLITAIDDAEEHSYGSDSDGQLAAERTKAINYYLGKMPPAPDGRSQVVDRSVYETIQWQRPSLSRIFAGGENVVELPPIGPEDEEGAKQEGEYLNYLLIQKNNWFQIFNTACTDALLTKAGYLYAYRETRKQLELESYKRQTQEGVALLMQDKPEVLNFKEYPDEEAQPQPMMDPATQQPVMDEMGQPVMQQPMLYDLDIRRTKEEVHYCVAPLPPERCKVAESHNEVQLVNCPYFEYYDFCTISYLREMGLDVPDDISDDENHDALEDSARDQYAESTWDRGNPVDPAMRKVKTRWIWIQHDHDEDGLSELNYVIRVGREILHREECNEIPVGVLCPDPLPHRHVGLSAADAAMEMQDVSTSVLRQGMDNLYLSQNPQKFADPLKVNLDDMLVSRPGGITRIKSGAVFMQDFGVFQVPNVFPDAMGALEYFKQMREDRTGVGRTFSGTDPNTLNKTATQALQQSTMSAQRVEQIARYFANGVERLCAVLHGLVLKGGHKADVVKLRGKWVTVDPSTWRKRTDFKICVGYSAGNKDAQINRLMMIAQMQEKALAGGLPIANAQNAYQTAIELTKASDFSNPDRFWTDPATAPPPPPPQPDVTVMAMEQLKAQSADNVKRMDVEQKERDSQRDAELKKYEIDVDAQVKLALANQQASQALELESKRGQQAAGIEQIKAQLNPKTLEANAKQSEVKQKDTLVQTLMERIEKSEARQEQMMKELLSAVGALNGPKRIVRDKAGRAVGTEPA